MSITSYAQNFEDVMLWRALQHVQNGCYIDIGAQDPLVDSVSLAFHQQGWYGVHVEPTPHYAELLRQQRPGDTVVQAAVGNGAGLLRFYEIPDTGISTGDPTIAAEHRERGFDVHEITVSCIPLAAVFDAAAGRDIHWLKVDVEGLEQQVLASWAPSAARPWIVVVESTRPLTQIESYDTWEHLLTAYGYTPVYFDGLNRYYIAQAHPELKEAFHSPPNVFDGFCLNGTASTPFHALITSRHQEQMDAVLAQAAQQKQAAQQDVARLTESISALEQTRGVQLQALQQKLTDHAQREQLLLDKNRQAKLEQQNLLRIVAQREQEASTQLLSQQLQVARDQVALASSHHAQEQALYQQLQAVQALLQDQQQMRIQREQEWAEQRSQVQKEQQALLHTFSQSEKQMAAQMQSIQTAAAEEKEALLSEQLKHERALARQLQTSQQELRRKEASLAQSQARLSLDITALQSEIQALQHSQQLQAQQHGFEISTQRDEHQRLVAACAAIETQLKAEVQSEQQAVLLLRQSLTEVQQQLANTRGSFSWRLTAPFRYLTRWLSPESHKIELNILMNGENKSLPPSEPVSSRDTNCVSFPALVSGKFTKYSETEKMSFNPKNRDMNEVIKASSLEELISLNDKKFVRCAYRTLLDREPDPEGMAYYLRRIRMGFSKVQVLWQIKNSAEGLLQECNIPGLKNALEKYRKSTIPLIGGLIGRLNGVEGDGPVERKLRVIENKIHLFSIGVDDRFNKIEVEVSKLPGIMAKAVGVVISPGSEVENTNIYSDDLTSSHGQESGNFEKLSPRARDIYLKLKKTMIAHAGEGV